MSTYLTSDEWGKAHALAQSLSTGDADRNEFGKALAYFWQSGDKADFLKFLIDLPSSGFIRSGRTQNYFRTIARACKSHLTGLDDERALLVAGWAFRLFQWYSLPALARNVEQEGGGS